MPTAPHLVRWDEELGKRLEIIAVYDGVKSSVGLVRGEIKKEKIKYPILFDCGARMRKILGVRGYPRVYLVGTDGRVAWEGSFSKGLRKRIDGLLEKAGKDEPKK